MTDSNIENDNEIDNKNDNNDMINNTNIGRIQDRLFSFNFDFCSDF
jgi:hypothetical protein